MFDLTLLDYAWFVIVIPVVEELIFRGIIQEYLLQQRLSVCWVEISIANLLATLCFVAAHWFFRDPITALMALPASLVFGWVYERRRTVLWPIGLHILANALWLIAMPFFSA